MTINKLRNWKQSNIRNYYRRPTPLYFQYEERGRFTSSHYDGTSMYQWNIDGKSKHEIMSTVQEMTTVVAVYKFKRFTSEQATTGPVTGFTEQLKNWWDNFFDPKTRDEIFNQSYRRIDDKGTKR